MRRFLTRLLDAPGPSGFEGAAASVWREEADTFAESVWTDVHGNSFAAINPEAAPRVMIAGHIDEIALMVHYIDDEGYLFVKGVGGWDPQVLVGQRVELLAAEGPVVGVIGRRAIHLIERDQVDKSVKLKELWIDIGALSGTEARGRVRIGDVAVVRSDTVKLANDRIAGRSVDDRVGAVVALAALRRAAEKGASAGAIAVATCQEEIGYISGGGARTGSFGVEPQVALVVDVTHATDHPSVERTEHGDIKLGGGPVLSRGAAVNPVVFDKLVEAARKTKIPCQLLAAPGLTGTDADAIRMSRTGVATGLVGIPNRYMHTPNQLVSAEDLENAAELIATFVVGLSADDSFLPA